MKNVDNLDLENTDYDFFAKLIIIGNCSVGKTCLLLKFTQGQFIATQKATVAVDFQIRALKIHDSIVKIQIWDTAGQEKFQNISLCYYRGASGCIIVYDITNRESFNNIGHWVNNYYTHANNGRILLVGNKIDLQAQREVSYQEALKLAESYDIQYIEVSAKSGENVETMFRTIARDVFQRYRETPMTTKSLSWTNISLSIKQQPKKKRRSCCHN